MKKHILATILVLSTILMLTSCGQSNNISDTISSPSSNESALSTDDTSDAVQDPINEAEEPDKGRTYFTVDFFGEAAGNPMYVSLVLPEDWTSDPSGIFDNQGNWIASVELCKKEADKAFADIDEQYKNPASIKEMTVSGYPAKLYVLEFEKLGNGEREAGTQYLYYIMVDDVYVLVFFGPKGTTDIGEDEFDEIVSSFGVTVG